MWGVLGVLFSTGVLAWTPQSPVFKPTVQRNGIDPSAQGRWNLASYGLLLDFSAPAVAVYDQAGKLCWRDSEYTDAASVNDLVPYFAADSATSRLFASAPDGTRYPVMALSSVPSACTAVVDRTAPLYIFDAITTTLVQFYPFAREHHVDWAQRATRLRGRAALARTDRDLRDVLVELFRGFDDAHTSISGTMDGQPFRIRSFRGRDFEALQDAYAGQNHYRRFLDWLKDAWMSSEAAQASALLIPHTRHEALGGGLVWGRLQGEVGYLAINEMAGFGNDTDLAADRALLSPVLDKALGDLADTRALVLDISHNLGGDDEVAADIASRFADRTRSAYSKQAFHGGVAQSFMTVPHDGIRYLKPVYLLTSELTASAAEVFTMRMRELPNVIQVGEPTQGIFSDATEKGLPNGWILSLSTEVYRDAHGDNHEGVGLLPEVPYPVIGLGHSAGGYRDAILHARGLAVARVTADHATHEKERTP